VLQPSNPKRNAGRGWNGDGPRAQVQGARKTLWIQAKTESGRRSLIEGSHYRKTAGKGRSGGAEKREEELKNGTGFFGVVTSAHAISVAWR